MVAIDQAQEGRGASRGSGGKAEEVAAQAKEQVQQKTEEVKGKASDRVREQLDTRSTQVGNQTASFSEALRRAGEHLQSQGNDAGAKAAHRAAEQVERLGGYLTNSSSDRFLGDLEKFGRQRPWAAGAIGVVVGFVGARFLKASSEMRYAGCLGTSSDADTEITRERASVETLPPAPSMVSGHGSP